MSMHVMRVKHRNNIQFNKIHRVTPFVLYTTNTGKLKSKCMGEKSYTPIIQKSYWNYNNNLHGFCCRGGNDVSNNTVKNVINSDNHSVSVNTERIKNTAINCDITPSPNDIDNFNNNYENMGKCSANQSSRQYICLRPVITKDLKMISASEYIQDKKSKLAECNNITQTLYGNKKCTTS